jgi:FkbM family methyltransferase
MITADLLIKRCARFFGVDVRSYHPSRSESARFGSLLNHYGIDLVFDVGANSGQFVQYLQYVGYLGRIICFEPLSAPHAQLEQLATRDSRIVCAPRMAIGDIDGELRINVASNLESSSVLKVLDSHLAGEPQARTVDCVTVPVQRLDTAVKSYQYIGSKSFLKIDVQGYEPQVLAGASELLPELAGLQLELSLTPLYEGELGFREMIDLVEREGFTLHDLNPCYSDSKTGRTYQVDALFFRC